MADNTVSAVRIETGWSTQETQAPPQKTADVDTQLAALQQDIAEIKALLAKRDEEPSIQEALKNYAEKAKAGVADLPGMAQEAKDSVDEWLRDHPSEAALISATGGAVAALLITELKDKGVFEDAAQRVKALPKKYPVAAELVKDAAIIGTSAVVSKVVADQAVAKYKNQEG
ncbi:MAG: hypothetical protein HYU64_21695 [Armatimonadetes bacterium]|nr:hypothetical protein [Armatimonadota bacterium]